jgi:RimJ/RimL family protein N-acetyltransferase
MIDMDNFRIFLRALEPNDYVQTHVWRSSPEYLSGVVSVRRFISLDTEKRWIDNAIKEHEQLKAIRFAIILKEPNEMVGVVYLKNIDLLSSQASVGIIVGSNMKKGIGYEAMVMCLNYAFMDLGIERVHGRIFEHNIASIKLVTKVGWVREGLLRNAAYKDGKYCNLLLYSMLKDEYIEKYISNDI